MSLLNKLKNTSTEDEYEAQDDSFLDELQNEEPEAVIETATEDGWLEEDYEGQLSVDVFQTTDEIVIKSTIAGVKPEDLDVTINNDMVTIKGKREEEKEVKEDNYFYQECYWGGFSRSIILPIEVKSEQAKAQLKNGVLTIRLPKAKKSKTVSVKISGD
ncbi:MAG: Hsp20/alpha crystallin family protein [Patescibacteria group bacterium]